MQFAVAVVLGALGALGASRGSPPPPVSLPSAIGTLDVQRLVRLERALESIERLEQEQQALATQRAAAPPAQPLCSAAHGKWCLPAALDVAHEGLGAHAGPLRR